jgi:hypothetical protein
MDENVPEGNPPKDFNKIDLTQLQGFSFGTQWAQDKSTASDQQDRSEHPRREGRSSGPGGGGFDKRDRRAFRRPNGGPDAAGPGQAQGPYPAQDRREGHAGQPRDQAEYRPAGARHQGPAGERRPRFGGRSDPPERRVPYESPYYAVTFYPEDNSFGALVKTVRASCRTIELFEIARTVLGKPERFTASVAPRRSEPAQAEAAAQPVTAAKPPGFFVSVPDGLPFETEEAAIAHVVKAHLGTFFDSAEAEVAPPTGNFQVVNRCTITGELLGPPNYHKYSLTLQQHFAAKINRMSFEEYRTRVESVRDPLVVQQWLDRMKKVTRYTWRTATATVPATPTPQVPAPAAAPEQTPALENAPVLEHPPAMDPAPEAAAAPAVPDAPVAPSFDSLEEAKAYLLANARPQLIREVETLRVHGRVLETLPQGEILRAIEGELERQRRFPLDTANALRGRLRREHFTIFKKGAKGVSYVCAVKRKFRVPGQTFSENIGSLIAFVEERPMVKAGELLRQFLGLSPSGTQAPGDAPAPAQELTAEQREKMMRVQADLLWLVREGYVTEFIDGSLYASPPVVEARRSEVEASEVDPENFPEVQAAQAGNATEEVPQAAPRDTEAAAPAESAPVTEPAPVDDAPGQPGA